jgi:hypothetical protein
MSEVNESQVVEQIQEKQVWTNDEVLDLMDELDSALGMMSPYYSQCNGGQSGYDLLQRLRAKQDLIGPYFENVLHATSCQICQKDFGRSNKGRRMDEHQQHGMAMAHIKDVHGIEDYKERRKLVVKPYYMLVEFEHRKAYLDSIVS